MTDPTEDDDLERLAANRRRARGLHVAARRALRLARRYRSEEGPRGEREAACVRQALLWRAAARALRQGPLDVPDSKRPGVARASVPPSSSQNRQSG